MWIIVVGIGGYPFYVSASEIVNCAGGWMSQSPRPRSHARYLFLTCGAIDSYHLLHPSYPGDCRARQLLPLVRQVEPPSPCHVST